MLIKHIRKDFYDNLIGKRVLVVVNSDVDAVCTTKILFELFRVDSISYSLLVVDGFGLLKSKFAESALGIKIVIMINCGAGVDILQMLGHPKEQIFYIIDHHRPIHISNYYNETNQIRLLAPSDEVIDIPAFDDIFNQDVMSESDDDEEDDDVGSEDVAISSEDEDMIDEEEIFTLSRKREKKLKSRRKKRDNVLWENRRNQLIYKYTEYCSFTAPSALIALELSWSKSRDDTQFVWWAIVALADSVVMNRLSRQEYTLKATDLHAHIARITHATSAPRDCLKISFENELCFYLYRHWTLYDSIKMTPYSAATLKTWSLKGEGRFHELLGELGLPLVQCRQKFTCMDLGLRRKLRELFSEEDIKAKYKLEMITMGSFVAEIGFHTKYSAFDNQLSTLAVLEDPDPNLSIAEKFSNALECLSNCKHRRVTLDKGLGMAKIFLEAMFRQVQAMLNTNSVGPRGEYLHAEIPEGAPDLCYFKSSGSLLMFAQFMQQAIISTARSRRWVTMPFVLAAPVDLHWWSIVGIRPLSNEVTDNMFGKIFEELARSMPDNVLLDSCDPNIIMVKREERHRFLQLLEFWLL